MAGTKQLRGDAATDAIVAATRDLIAAAGYTALTMDAVAERAGVALATIYRRWPTKQALVVVAARSGLAVPVVPDIGNLREEVRIYMVSRLSWFQNNESKRATAAIAAAIAEDPSLGPEFAQRTEELAAPLDAAIRRAIDRGEIRPETDIAAVKSIVSGSLTFTDAQGTTPDITHVDAVLDILVNGLAHP